MTSQPSLPPAGRPPQADYAKQVRLAIECGLADGLAGRTIPVAQVRAMFDLDP